MDFPVSDCFLFYRQLVLQIAVKNVEGRTLQHLFYLNIAQFYRSRTAKYLYSDF